MPSIFVLGATGYIGGAVLFTLLQEMPDLNATALVRSDTHVTTLSELGVTCLKGDNKDTALITELASKADIVLNAADADDATLAGAILQGCKLKFESTSIKSMYIHTSGLAVLGDRSEGVFDQASPVYDDRYVDAIKAISPTAIHRNVEQLVVNADEAGYVSAFIVSPSSAYGETPSPVPRPMLLVSLLIKIGSALKGLPYVGDGTNVSPFVHIKDLAAAYVIIVKHALSGTGTDFGYGKYYIVSGPEISWKEVVEAYGTALKQKGILQTAEPVLVTYQQVPLMRFFGANTRGNSGKLQELGWKPTSPSLFEEVERDVENALRG